MSKIVLGNSTGPKDAYLKQLTKYFLEQIIVFVNAVFLFDRIESRSILERFAKVASPQSSGISVNDSFVPSKTETNPENRGFRRAFGILEGRYAWW